MAAVAAKLSPLSAPYKVDVEVMAGLPRKNLRQKKWLAERATGALLDAPSVILPGVAGGELQRGRRGDVIRDDPVGVTAAAVASREIFPADTRRFSRLASASFPFARR